ncbi:MAG: DUF4192 domain-containing protein [Actinomycetota bacterium]|uniref:DUF4192 domain-containing protein n=1 Tax=Mycobacterium lentiflavum TaxID=141349 RepID=A0ABY3UX95_MYCLN|nr:DUF4192 domain-containing protein [Mycobacterium lentiflavum]MEE3067315.1 DUF4192 domain-containing protein [Actinomycetota bacterium]ULP44207.1 DUF4192 domain-containing protein [Mycobacterium lentiflavum]
MTRHTPDFELNRPGALIAALPAVLGFVPENSLVLVSLERGELGAVLRVDLSDELVGRIGHLAEVTAAASPEAVIAVIVNDEGAGCPQCNEEYRQLCAMLAEVLSENNIDLLAAHVVDRVARGGRWHCVDECGASGAVEDPSASPLAAAAVLEGRRLYSRRADLLAVMAVEDAARSAALAGLLDEQAATRAAAHRADPAGCCRRDVERAMAAAARVAGGRSLTDDELAALGCALDDAQVRDTLYALAVGEKAADVETLWASLARILPAPWRVEALVLLAFSAYVRGDGPLAGVSLEAALRCDPDHRMAGMLDTALQSGLRPEQIRELAATGYRLAKRLGVRLPPRRASGRCAG